MRRGSLRCLSTTLLPPLHTFCRSCMSVWVKFQGLPLKFVEVAVQCPSQERVCLGQVCRWGVPCNDGLLMARLEARVAVGVGALVPHTAHPLHHRLARRLGGHCPSTSRKA